MYAKGTGKECREFVQDLNQQRLLIKQNTTNEVETTRDCSNDIDEADLDEQICKKPKLGINDDLSKKTSKWDEFLCNRKSNLTLINCNEDEKKCTELEDILQNLNDKSCDKVETQNTSETKMKQNNDVSSNFYKRRFESIGDFDFDLEF